MRNNNVDTFSASSGSPPVSGFLNLSPPLVQHRDHLSSDMEINHNSNDHNDIKDLSLKGQPQQAAIITSTAPAIHLDTSSNPDFDSSRASSVHLDIGHPHESVLRTGRVRKLSDSCHDNEHHNNYKFKNYIQQRFSQDTHHMDDTSSVMTDCGGDKSPSLSGEQPCSKKPKLTCLDYAEGSSCDEKPSTNGSGGGGIGGANFKTENGMNAFQMYSKPIMSGLHNPVPIFALHAQGRFYVPLNVEYDAVLPYLGGVDLFDKSCGPMPPLHAININVNFAHSRLKTLSCQPRGQRW